MHKLTMIVLGLALSMGPSRVRAQQEVQLADPQLIFNYTNMIVSPQGKLHLDCGTTGDVNFCSWEIVYNDGHPDRNLYAHYQVQDVTNGKIHGMTRPKNQTGNECGIVLDMPTNPNITAHGTWTCSIFGNGTGTLTGKKNVTTTIKPIKPDIKPHDIWIKNEEERHTIECKIRAARPQANITWVLDGEDITSNANTVVESVRPVDTYMTVSTLSHVFKKKETAQKLACVITQAAFPKPLHFNVPIGVGYTPELIKDVDETFQESIHNYTEVKVSFNAKPRPTNSKWTFGRSFGKLNKELSIPTVEGRLSTDLKDLGDNKYQAVLKIGDVSGYDRTLKYLFQAENVFGTLKYKVTLHPSSGGCSAGDVISAWMLYTALLISALFL